MRRILCVLLLTGCLSGTQGERPEAISLLGTPLLKPELGAEIRKEREELLAAARRAWERNPGSANATIWLGRRTAYLGRYREAIDIFSRGIRRHPGDARLYRHRGHRYITVRELHRAVDDLTRAASLIAGQPDQVEPDGLPNSRKIPTSTLQFNIWYHLGLAHYLRGEFAQAAAAYARCMEVSRNPDSQMATGHWYYMTLRRLGREGEARELLRHLDSDAPVIENESYRALIRMYKGLRTPEELLAELREGLDRATVGYGVGNWYRYNRRESDAVRVFEGVLATGEWPAFGLIAAEAEIARLRSQITRSP